jgi:hypothetical protein
MLSNTFTSADLGIYEFTMGTTGDKVKGRFSFVYVWEDEQWKISHHHSSVMPEAFLGPAPVPYFIDEATNGAKVEKVNGVDMEKVNGAKVEKVNGAKVEKVNGVDVEEINGVGSYLEI